MASPDHEQKPKPPEGQSRNGSLSSPQLGQADNDLVLESRANETLKCTPSKFSFFHSLNKPRSLFGDTYLVAFLRVPHDCL
ncbi:hypothetical protein DdX_03305 [Ditylenchus destructor]|uniref:Uncharacterized protein n=1 Tax=Ditylenchus destructor TaxID=166010 RepID=A0AAD4NGD8_9BILA|nr:hypothetical protein DdX_03305 [Ditylenchus destructor]